MEDFNHEPIRNDAIARAIAGDPSGGIDPRWFAIGGHDGELPIHDLQESGKPASSISLLIAAGLFVVISALFW